MLKPELEQLIRQSLRALSAEELESADGVHRYRLHDGLKERLGREEILLTFSARTAAQRTDVDLVTAGSYLYDLVLRLVRERGRAAAGWLAPASGVDPEAAILKVAPRLKGRTLRPVKRSWGVIYLFTFRFGFHFDTPHEKLYTVRVDHDGERVRHDVHPWRLVESATPEPPAGAGDAAPRVDPERAFRFAWEKVEEEVARLTTRYGQEAEVLLRDEIQTVEQYYRQLIEEEKRVREQKNTRRGREESEQKIELLKLEWDRRVAEEKRRLRPEVAVVLSCAAYLRTPLERWKCAPRAGTREALAEFWVDLHSGEAWPLRGGKRKAAPARLPRRGAGETPEPGLEAPPSGGPHLALIETDGPVDSPPALVATPLLTPVPGGLDGSADDVLPLGDIEELELPIESTPAPAVGEEEGWELEDEPGFGTGEAEPAPEGGGEADFPRSDFPDHDDDPFADGLPGDETPPGERE